jgi:hypothetical protein
VGLRTPNQTGPPNGTPAPTPDARRAPAAIAAPSDQLYANIDSIAEAAALPTDFAQTQATYVLAGRADEATLQRYIAEADMLARRNDRVAVRQILFSRYTELDPHAALAYLDRVGSPPKIELLFLIFNSWAKVDLDAAIEAARERSDSREQQVANDAILRAYEDADRETIGRIETRLPGPSDGTRYSPDEIVNTSMRDPELALAEATKLDGNARFAVATEIGGRWARRDAETAYEHANEIADPAMRLWFERGVFYEWAQVDPERVVAILNETSGRRLDDILAAAIAGLAAGRPDIAFASAQGLTAANARLPALQEVTARWAASDPQAAAVALEGIDDASMRENLTSIVGRSFAQKSPSAAIDWARRSGNPGAWRAVLEGVAATDPQYALDLASTASNERERRELQAAVLAAIAATDPATAALQWQQRGDPEADAWVLAQIADQWHSREPAAAEQWLLNLPPSGARDSALASVQWKVADPNAAVRLINAMQSEDQRRAAVQTWADRLLNANDRATVEALMGQVVLSSESRAALRQYIDGPRN